MQQTTERQRQQWKLGLEASVDRDALLLRVARLLPNVAIIGLWLWLYRPLFDYLSIIFSRDDFRTNQIMLIGVVVLILVRTRREITFPRLDAWPQLHLPASR